MPLSFSIDLQIHLLGFKKDEIAELNCFTVSYKYIIMYEKRPIWYFEI